MEKKKKFTWIGIVIGLFALAVNIALKKIVGRR